MNYNIFISWSGQRSKWIAETFRDWLPVVLQAAHPWMSDREIQKGGRGLHEVSRALEGIKVGITCLTPENLNAPWILYEAGALSKALDDKTHLCTYLLGGLQFQDVNPPLGMFQSTKPEREDTRRLVSTINSAITETPVSDSNLNQIFDAMWPKFEEKLASMPSAEEAVVAKRTLEEMIAEILEINRAEANRRKKGDHLELFLPLFEEVVPILPQIRDAIRAAKTQIITASSVPSDSAIPAPVAGPPAAKAASNE